MAASLSIHQISDSDSDATVPPSDIENGLDGSQDLFDTNSSEAFAISSNSFIQKTRMNKSVCNPHEISGSDTDEDVKPKIMEKPVKASNFQSSKKQPAFSGKRHSVSSLSQGYSSPLASSSVTCSSTVGACVSGHESQANNMKPRCKYGDKCFRKNPSHLKEFYHGGKGNGKSSDPHPKERKKETAMKAESETNVPAKRPKLCSEDDKTVIDTIMEFQPISFFLTKVAGIDDKFNMTGAVSLKDILSPLMGDIQASCQFNFMFDIPWLMKQYPACCRNKPLLIVHGEKGKDEAEMKKEAKHFSNISLVRAQLDIMFGTHHTKMMLLLYDCGMRVVIHTANLISNDWHQKTQGVWISPLFPRMPKMEASKGTKISGDSPTHFKQDLLDYLSAYKAQALGVWEEHVHQHDMTAACVHIIGSVPGRHSGDKKMAWGHLKLHKVLQTEGPDSRVIKEWPVLGQFSSIGSLGSSMDKWLCAEWLTSFSQCRGSPDSAVDSKKLLLVYPSKENVRQCLEGYGGGGCLPYSIQTARKQIYLNNFVRQWRAEGRGRTEAIPHIKTYTRVSPDWTQAAWFLVTSANLSKAAWGSMEKQNSQLMIRSYEIGVLFLPKYFGSLDSFPVGRTAEDVSTSDHVVLPFPYDLPPPVYEKGDRIWMWDVPCVDKPDRHGNKYCPRL